MILSLLLLTEGACQSKMRRKEPEDVRQAGWDSIARIRDQIRRLEYVCSGTLLKRRKVCGKPGCLCARDPAARHGPYYEWGYMKQGMQVHRMVSQEQARLLRRAIANYRAIRRLLKAWEAQTIRIIEAETADNK